MNRRWILLACGSGLAGILAGLMWPPPPIPRARMEATEWSLPSPDALTRHAMQDATQVTGKARWGGETGTGPGGSGNSGWRLAGFVNDPDPAALILPQAETPAPGAARRAAPRRASTGTETVPSVQAIRAVPGDTLPDGSRMVAIDGDTITTERDDCRLVHQLYHPQPIQSSPGCSETADAAEPRKTE